MTNIPSAINKPPQTLKNPSNAKQDNLFSGLNRSTWSDKCK